MRQLAMRERHADVIQHVAGKEQQREVAQRQDAGRYRMLAAEPVLVFHLPEQLRQRVATLDGVVQAAQRCRRHPLGASVGTDLPSRHDVVRLREIAQKAGRDTYSLAAVEDFEPPLERIYQSPAGGCGEPFGEILGRSRVVRIAVERQCRITECLFAGSVKGLETLRGQLP